MFVSIGTSFGQWNSMLEKVIVSGPDTIRLDSLSIIPGELKLYTANGLELDSTQFDYNPWSATLWFLGEYQTSTSEIRAQYRLLADDLSRKYSHLDRSIILAPQPSTASPNYTVERSLDAYEPFVGLNKNGSITRGVTVGNNQDLVLNSDLNLQLSGQIAPNTYLRASISDNNLPIQSGGYTQRLGEFDRAYIEIEQIELGKIRAGDYLTGSQLFYFNPYKRKISGAGLETQYLKSRAGETFVSLDGALSRGKFSRNVFMADEGNQGPYKLNGAENEQFIIILSGTERVYIDGLLMTRGEENDYVIDYNAAEISFTPKQPMTSARRIIVEFQYNDQSYARYIARADLAHKVDKWSFKAGYFTERDAKNQPLQQGLTDEDQLFLSTIGNDLDQAFVPSYDSTGFISDQINYAMIDSLGFDSVFIVSNDPALALYQVSFSYLGHGKGDYVLEQADVNGRIFKWVAPVAGVSQGSYAPVRVLITPKTHDVFQFGLAYGLEEESGFAVEGGWSDYDLNDYSDLDEEENRGSVLKASAFHKQQFNNVEWFGKGDYEFVDGRFKTVERFRSVEFIRDWNINDSLLRNDQQAASGDIVARFGQASHAKYAIEWLDLGPYSGLRHHLDARYMEKETFLRIKGSALFSDQDNLGTEFLREITRFNQNIKLFRVGFRSEGERNDRSSLGTRSSQSYLFHQLELYVGSKDTLGTFWELRAFDRFDRRSYGGVFEDSATARSYTLKGGWMSTKGARLSGSLNFRNFESKRDTVNPENQTLTSRVRYDQSFVNGGVRVSAFYEAGSGNEARREFTYIEVPAGQGVYAWNDYNENGIQELSEFEIAKFPDEARYIRVFTQSNEYLRNYNNQFNAVVMITPSAWIKATSGPESFWKKWSVQGSYQSDRRTDRSDFLDGINPFGGVSLDSNILGVNQNLRTSVFFNRSAGSLGGEYTISEIRSRNLVSYGFENRSVFSHNFTWRWEVFPSWFWNAGVELQDQGSFVEGLSNRNYDIQAWSTEHKISYQLSRNRRISIVGKTGSKENTSEGTETLDLFSLGLESWLGAAEKGQISLRADWIQNNFDGNANSPVAYEILSGLQDGQNITWMITAQRNLARFLQLSVQYSGRASELAPTIHTGSVQLKAFF